MNEKLKIDNMTLDITDLRRKSGDSIRLLTSAHSNIFISRKVSLHPYLDKKFHYLTKDSNPVTSLLLGGDLEQKITEMSKVSDVAKHLTFTCNQFPRMRGSRGQHYQFQRQGMSQQYTRKQFDRCQRRQPQ